MTRDTVEYKSNHFLYYRACKVNQDVSRKLQTRCQYYLNKSYSDDKDIMNEVEKTYNERLPMNIALGRLKLAKSKIP